MPKKSTTSNLNITPPICITKQILKNGFELFITDLWWLVIAICVICRTPVCKIYWKCQLSLILRRDNILINKTEQKLIQNISCATIRHFRWLIMFCIICRTHKFSKDPQKLNYLQSSDKIMFGSVRQPRKKLLKLLNN